MLKLEGIFIEKFDEILIAPNQTLAAMRKNYRLGSLLPFAARCTNVRLEAKL